MPTRVGSGSGGFNPLDTQSRTSASRDTTVDADGWGSDAPQVTRTQLEKVQSAYQPTKVNMRELTSQKPEISKYNEARNVAGDENNDSVKGAYQPVGKVDIAAIRRQAQDAGTVKDDRPAPVKGSYEPIGKVDIAAIRAKAQGPSGNASPSSPPISSARTGNSAQGTEGDPPRSLADRSAAFSASERITTMPRPKVANKFGANTSSFTGTKAPLPGSFEGKSAAPIGLASRTFADEGGKTPAQIWAEKKGRQRGSSGAGGTGRPEGPISPIASQPSGGGDWKSGYSGKSWAPVQTSKTGQPASSGTTEQLADEEPAEEVPISPSGNVGAIRDRFKGAAPMGAPSIRSGSSGDEPIPPPMDISSKPNAGNARGVSIPSMPPREQSAEEDIPEEEPSRLPSPPAQPPRTPTPPTPTGSPIRVAMPVARGKENEMKAPQELHSPPAMPIQSLQRIIPAAKDLEDESQAQHDDPARAAGQAAAATTFGTAGRIDAVPEDHIGGKRALIMFDYEKAEENELELIEGEYVTNIEMVDEDWWMGQNSKGEAGLFPSNYVELAAETHKVTAPAKVTTPATSTSAPPAAKALSLASKKGPTATAQYDYEAVEDNELSFPDGATITALVSSMFLLIPGKTVLISG